ncbi:hypothetical protein BCIN_01g04590 [Botrytis cinerea B05.10]|uniref:Uncharacterized protein n=2 Tax=Botryotinia fuckeliana (strain B05.10) TaxID=332648 RepID=A0A384J5J3_BOTFB|nr:hypothetical protein BCIN_01g04590 [Botrytis cinerea B05.10]ATZ45733.1 hypothetical protein BCIN_01g04590 [Botrytis cinerea B05.10]
MSLTSRLIKSVGFRLSILVGRNNRSRAAHIESLSSKLIVSLLMLMPTISSPSVDSVIIAVSTPGVPKFYAKAFGTEDSCPET